MLQQIKQVGMTYVTHRYLGWGALLVSMIILPQLLLTGRPRHSSADNAQPMLMVLGMPLFFLMPFLVGHVKMQFANSRARLLPNFLPAHIIVLCGVLLTLLVLYPLLIAGSARFAPLGPIALAVAIGAPAIWGAHLNRFLPMLISLAVFYSLLTNWGLHWWIIDAPSHPELHGLVLLAGTILLVSWPWRLCYLHEETDDYQSTFQWKASRRSGSEVVEQRRIIAEQIRRNRLTSWIGDTWHAELGGYFGGSQAGLTRLLRYGFGVLPIELRAGMMAAMMLAIALFLTQLSYVGQSGGMGALWFLIQFAVLLPGYMGGEQLAQRRPRIATEMMLPVARPQLVDGLLTAATWNAAVMWLAMNATLAIVVGTMSDKFSLAKLAMYSLLSLAVTVATLGLSLRVAIWDSLAKRLAMMMLSWFVLAMPMIAWWTTREEIGDWPFAFAAGGLIALGMGLFLEARRAWLNLELG